MESTLKTKQNDVELVDMILMFGMKTKEPQKVFNIMKENQV